MKIRLVVFFNEHDKDILNFLTVDKNKTRGKLFMTVATGYNMIPKRMEKYFAYKNERRQFTWVLPSAWMI